MRQRFAPGEVLFREGDPSDWVVLVRSGQVEVSREVAGTPILLGTAGDGEFVGEMGVLEGRPRSATARAASTLEVELIERRAFLERVSHEPDLAHKLLIRMSARLRHVEDLLAGLHASVRAEAGVRGSAGRPSIALSGATYAAKFYIGVAPIAIERLPFTVGRRPGPQEVVRMPVDLEIAEPEPYRLSPVHFGLHAEGDQVIVRDLNSELGTIVNQTALGQDFPVDSMALHQGDNSVVAGGRGSPFVFTITLA